MMQAANIVQKALRKGGQTFGAWQVCHSSLFSGRFPELMPMFRCYRAPTILEQSRSAA